MHKTKNMILLLLSVFFIIGCATMEQQNEAIEGVVFETGQPRQKVMEALVNILLEEGYDVDNINEKFGIVSAKPYKILTGKLMKKLGEPGGGFVGTNSHLVHTIEFSANITKEGRVRLKALASEEADENIFAMMANPQASRRSLRIDVFRTNKLTEYYKRKLTKRLQLETE